MARQFLTDIELEAQRELRFKDADSSAYVGFKSPATVSTDLVWTLPATDGTTGQALTTNGSAVLSWATGGTTFTYSSSAPGSPSAGNEWLDSTSGILYTYVNDGNSLAWVELGPFPTIGATGPTGPAGPTGPTGPAGDSVTVGINATDILSITAGEITADDAAADKIVFWDDSASKLTYLTVGSNLTITDTTIAATGSGTKTYTVFTPDDNQPPASDFATLDTRNSILVLDFDEATDESAIFVGVIPEAASLGSGLKIRLHWMATTATSGDCIWDVSLERMTTDLDSDSFDTIASATTATSGTSGIPTVTEITLTTIDSVTAGDGYRLKVTRNANNEDDTMTGDAELVVVEVRSAA